MGHPMPLVARYEQVTASIEKRLLSYTKSFDHKQTVRQWIAQLYCDQDLIAWDCERRDLEADLPLGYFQKHPSR